MADKIDFEIVRDYGGFGDGKWQKHLTLISWYGKPPVFDIRPWNEDMTKMGKGITFSKDDIFDLVGIFEDILEEGDV